MNFKKEIENMSENNKKLFAYYGDWSNESSYRASLSCTKVDEYIAIRQSLYIMYIIMRAETVEEIMLKLAIKYNEDGFRFDGLDPATEKEKSDYIANFQALLKIRNDLMNKWKNEFEEKLISVFLYHDLGKQIAFVKAYNLSGSNEPIAASNESYLKNYFKTNEILAKDFEYAAKWVDVIDGLGYNPKKLLSSGYVGLLTSVDKTIDYLHDLNEKNDDKGGNSIESFNYYLFNKAKELELNIHEFEFLKSEDSKRLLWSKLPFEQQQKVIMLVLSCSMTFVKPPLDKDEVIREFITKWKDDSNTDIVKRMTGFMVKNMTSSDPIMLYNITGLLHHTSAQGGSHFANDGTVDELFKVFFPYVLEVVEQRTLCSFNKYQLLQGIEICFNMIQNLTDGSQLMIRNMNFASKQNKSNYLKVLADAKVMHKEESVKLVSLVEKTASPIFSNQTQFQQQNQRSDNSFIMDSPKSKLSLYEL